MTKENCTPIGQIVRTHGINGALIWKIEDSFPEDFTELESVFVEIDNILVPFFIASYKVRNTETAIVKLDDIDADNEAKEVMYKSIFIDKDYFGAEDDSDVTYGQLVGYTAIQQPNIVIGTVTDIIQIPNNELFEIDNKGNQVLVPINDDWIIEIDTELKRIDLQLPEGLIDLNKEE